MIGSRLATAWLLIGSTAFLLAPGCDQEKAEPGASPVPSTSARAPVLDSKVAQAVSKVTQGNPGLGAGAADGPPPNGVFPPGKADSELRAGQPAVLTLGSSGDGTKWKFGPAGVEPGRTFEFELEVAHATGARQALPTLIYSLKLKADKPKTEAPKADPALPVPTPAAPAEPIHVIAEVAKVTLAETQPGAIPADLQKAVKTLEHSKIFYDLMPDGATFGFGFELSKAATTSLDGVLRPAVEAFANFITAYPAEPVGVGAFWMVKSRESYGHVDVVAYRMFKVEEAVGDAVKVSVNVRRFASEPITHLPEIPTHQLLQFGGDANGALALRPGEPFPIEGAMTETLQLALGIEGSEQPAVVRAQGSIGFRQKLPTPK